MELWDIYDSAGHLTGHTFRKGELLRPGDFHLATEAWILSHEDRILIQRRSVNCEVLPGIWALTSGRVRAGESSLAGCMREIREELGISIAPAQCSFLRRIWRPEANMIWDLYVVRMDVARNDFVLQGDEVADVRWVSRKEFATLLAEGQIFRYPEIEDVLASVAHFPADCSSLA